MKSCRCACILFRSFSVREATQFAASPNLHQTYDIAEDLTTQDSLLLLTSTGLFRAMNSGTTERLVSWSETVKYDLMSIHSIKFLCLKHMTLAFTVWSSSRCNIQCQYICARCLASTQRCRYLKLREYCSA